MNVKKKPICDITILCIDDEKNILSALKREFRSSGFKVLTAQSGNEGLSILAREQIDIAISDMKMPEMSGIEFFDTVTKKYPDVFRILLTGFTEMNALIDAINRGNVHRFFEKPWSKENLINTLNDEAENIRIRRQHASLQKQLKKQNTTLFSHKTNLEKKVEIRTQQVKSVLCKYQKHDNELHTLLFNMIKVNPYIDSHLPLAVSAMANRLATYCNLGKREIKDITLAAKFHNLGLLGLDIQSLSQPFEELSFTAQQRYLGQIHHVGRILNAARGLRNVEKILINQFEHTNGAGYPNKLSLEDIPIGSRILSISRDYWRYREGKIIAINMSHKTAVHEIKKYRGTRYDSLLVDILLKNPEICAYSLKSSSLSTPDLESGMRLRKSVFGNKYTLLLREGHVLTSQNIESFSRYEKVQNTKLKISICSQ